MGGFTCCVPGCFNNHLRERNLSYYKFPKDPVLRKTWIRNIGRAGNKGKYSLFKPTDGHRVCSEHFEGGKKTYMVSVPTILPEIKSSSTSIPRRELKRRHLEPDIIELGK